MEKSTTVEQVKATIHDVKNPLTVIFSYAEVILRNPKVAPEVQKAVEKIIVNAKRIDSQLSELARNLEE